MQEFSEKIPMQGIFELEVFQAGKLIEKVFEENLIVNGGKMQMARLVAGNVEGRSIHKIAFGTSGANSEVGDTLITNQWEKPISGFIYPANGRVQFDWELLVTENNGMEILEFGLLTADGTLFARRNRTNPVYKDSDISFEGHWTIIF
jgi:hypothetical protein